MMNVLTIGIGMIPVAGPFLAILFPIAWTLVVDPDSAYDLLKDLVPGIDLTDRMVRDILDSINETKDYLPDGWETLALPAQLSSGAQNAGLEGTEGREPISKLEDIGTSLAFLMAGETLAKSGRAPIEAEPADGDESSVIELVNPPTTFPDEKGELATFD